MERNKGAAETEAITAIKHLAATMGRLEKIAPRLQEREAGEGPAEASEAVPLQALQLCAQAQRQLSAVEEILGVKVSRFEE